MCRLFRGAYSCTRASNWCADYSVAHIVEIELVTGMQTIQDVHSCTRASNWCVDYSGV